MWPTVAGLAGIVRRKCVFLPCPPLELSPPRFCYLQCEETQLCGKQTPCWTPTVTSSAAPSSLSFIWRNYLKCLLFPV